MQVKLPSQDNQYFEMALVDAYLFIERISVPNLSKQTTIIS